MGFLCDPPRATTPRVTEADTTGRAPAERSWAEVLGVTPPPVEDSPDLRRIVALPRRPIPTSEEQTAMAEEMTRRLELHPRPCACPIHTLLPVQGQYLHEAASVGGALGLVSPGCGKTGIGLLLPSVLPGVRTAVILVPPALRVQMVSDALRWEQHFRLPNIAWTSAVRAFTGGAIDGWMSRPFYKDRPTLHILGYSELSSPKFSSWLKDVRPDLIIADEAQCLSDRKSTRTDRFLRFVAERAREGRPVKMAAHSGSLTTRSLTQYQHLAAVSLGENSPVPLSPPVAEAWDTALAPALRTNPAPPGALVALGPGHVREAFASRLLETEGVIATEDAAVPVQLTVRRVEPPPLAPAVVEALRVLRSEAVRPDGEELVDAAMVAATAKQLAMGCFYRWIFPRGESPELVLEWKEKRSAWFAELRRHLAGNRVDGMDSPGLLAEAAEREMNPHYCGTEPTWDSAAWGPWSAIKDEVCPEVEAVWLDDGVLRWAAEWGSESPSVIWTTHTAVAERLAEMTGWALHQGGTKDDRALAVETGEKTIIASVFAHGTGKNLQMFSRALLLGSLSDAGRYEQVLARHHRLGQSKDVTFDLVMHTAELRKALSDAMERARYVHGTTRTRQRLLFGLGEE